MEWHGRAVAGSIGLMKSRRATVSNTPFGGTCCVFSSWHFAVAAIAGKHHLVKVVDAAEPVSHEVSLQVLDPVDLMGYGFEVDGLRPQLIGGTPLSIGLASAGPSAASTFR